METVPSALIELALYIVSQEIDRGQVFIPLPWGKNGHLVAGMEL